jgi:hypothetical protein
MKWVAVTKTGENRFVKFTFSLRQRGRFFLSRTQGPCVTWATLTRATNRAALHRKRCGRAAAHLEEFRESSPAPSHARSSRRCRPGRASRIDCRTECLETDIGLNASSWHSCCFWRMARPFCVIPVSVSTLWVVHTNFKNHNVRKGGPPAFRLSLTSDIGHRRGDDNVKAGWSGYVQRIDGYRSTIPTR